MKVDLSKDPLFLKQQSPVKELKERELQRQRQMRIRRMNPVYEKREPNIQIIDPLPKELKTYRAETQIKTNIPISKASHTLKKYVIEQQRNLKCVRLERMDDRKGKSFEQMNTTSRSANVQLKFSGVDVEKQQKDNKKINIPRIQQMFKNQQREYVLYDSNQMKNALTQAIHSINNRVQQINNYDYLKRTTPVSRHGHKKGNASDHHHHGTHHSINRKEDLAQYAQDQEDLQLDQMIQKKLQKSARLRQKLYREKKAMTSHQVNKQSEDNKNMGFFLSVPQKKKKKFELQGIKNVTYYDSHNNKLSITPASCLLFQLNKLYNGRDLKEQQLSGLLKNSYRNRGDILHQKSDFYDSETQFRDLSPKNQMKLRQEMDKRLQVRLQLSRQQVNNFVDLLREIKQQYHVILNETMLSVLKEVREALISGKVMKKSDFTSILEHFDHSEIEGGKNKKIIGKIYEMMI